MGSAGCTLSGLGNLGHMDAGRGRRATGLAHTWSATVTASSRPPYTLESTGAQGTCTRAPQAGVQKHLLLAVTYLLGKRLKSLSIVAPLQAAGTGWDPLGAHLRLVWVLFSVWMGVPHSFQPATPEACHKRGAEGGLSSTSAITSSGNLKLREGWSCCPSEAPWFLP